MTKKVYELATEMGVGAIDLVEKLKTLGMNVRNHMVTLTDEEVQKAKAAFETTAKVSSAPKKTVVKKVVRKSPQVAQEEVVAQQPAQAPVAAAPEVEAPVAVTPTPVAAAEPVVSEVVTDAAAEEAKSKSVTVKRKTKLQIEDERRQEQEDRMEAAEKAKAPKEYYQERMHAFTPIFVPQEKKEDKEKDKPKEKVAGAPKTFGDGTAVGTDEEEEEKSKKRMGDLAAMMSKKAVVGKAKDITLLRAEEELKYVAALVGKAVYTPAKKKKMYSGPTQQTIITSVKESKRVIEVHGGTTASDLAQKLSVKFEAFANKMLEMNLLVRSDDYIGLTLAQEMAAIYNYRVEDSTFKEESVLNNQKINDKAHFPLRNPIITIMGHVDHGKTSLLDYIRKAKVANGEAGGITQHIGAYQVMVKNTALTFLDTPGHAAFASMRQRGANVTDIVVLVVAADDGVMPQTAESIRFCKNAGVPIIVAVNKMDKPQANPDKVKQGLQAFELTPEEWGGETIYVPVSALTGAGIDNLLESIQLQAEIMELREDAKGTVEGVVIESKIELGRGPVATVIVQKGTLTKGDYIIVGETLGRARSLMDYSGKMLNEAGPSTPVQILGLEAVPSPGDMLNVAKNEREARKIVDNRITERKAMATTAVVQKVTLEDFFAAAPKVGEEKKVLKLVVRSDVQGSFEAIKMAAERLGNNEVSVEVIGGGVGAITDNDVALASSANGFIIGFNMRPVTTARRMAEEKGIDVKTYSIIYELINDVTLALEGMLTPERIEKYIGRAQVRETFAIPKVGTIAGSSVVDGKIERGCNIRLLRDGKIIYDGKLTTLKRFKDEVKEVKNGYECGLSLDNFNDVKIDDVVEAYVMEEKRRTLEAPTATL